MRPPSALGRRLPLDHWSAFHGDTVLSVLYEAELRRAERDDRATVSLRVMHAMTGLEEGDALVVILDLVDAGRLWQASAGNWVITNAGIEFASLCSGRGSEG